MGLVNVTRTLLGGEEEKGGGGQGKVYIKQLNNPKLVGKLQL